MSDQSLPGALTRTEIQQLLGYAQHCEVEGWYCGNAAQFRKRHEKVKAWLNAQIDAADVIPTVPSLRQNRRAIKE